MLPSRPSQTKQRRGFTVHPIAHSGALVGSASAQPAHLNARMTSRDSKAASFLCEAFAPKTGAKQAALGLLQFIPCASFHVQSESSFFHEKTNGKTHIAHKSHTRILLTLHKSA